MERTSQRLMRQLYINIPAMGRAISILAGLTGVPDLVGADDAHTADLTSWSQNVRAGWSGSGLAPFLVDLIGQSLWHGYGVAEGQVGAGRDELTGLWSYQSGNFRLETDDDLGLRVFQMNARDLSGIPGGRELNPLTTCVATFDPQGSDPQGQPLFLACPTVGQVWVEALQAHKSTWRRMGIPVFHVNVELPEGFKDDASWTKTNALLSQVLDNLGEGIKSQVERGIAKDVATAGKVTISVLGLEGMAMDFQISKRQLLEEIVVASDVPPSLLGYSWSATERMSQVQMRKLLARVEGIQRAVTPCLRHLVDLRQRLRGEGRPYTLSWPDTSLTELTETARAAKDDADAALKRQTYHFNLWRAGITDQAGAAEALTGKPDVAREMEEPPGQAPPEPAGDRSETEEREEARESVPA
jgi:hypothetical protein